MSDERDTRVEELRPGDQVRYLGEWFDVVKVRLGIQRLQITDPEYLYDRNRGPADATHVNAPYVALSIDALDYEGRPRIIYFRRGHFVAAECNPRTEDVPA